VVFQDSESETEPGEDKVSHMQMLDPVSEWREEGGF
jgi:hypothetical protein